MLHALDSVYQAAKAYDKAIPSWPKLAKLQEQKVDSKAQAGALRVINKDGMVSNVALKSKGFVVGVQIENVEGVVYEITNLTDDQKVIKAKKIKDDGDDDEDVVEIIRTDLLSSYVINKDTKVVLVLGYASPAENKAFMISCIEGQLKHIMLTDFCKASNPEKHITLQKSPETAAIVQKKFAVGLLKLTPLTNCVVVDEKELDEPYICLGNIEVLGNVYIKSGNTPLKSLKEGNKKAMDEAIISKFFIVKSCETSDQRVANCGYVLNDIKLNLGTEKVTLRMPCIVNTKALQAEDHIVVSTPDEVVEPVRKIAKTAAKGKAKTRAKRT